MMVKRPPCQILQETSCPVPSSQKPKDDCKGLDTEYKELKCKILETFEEDECQQSGISGLWPSDKDSQICQIAASFTTDRESGTSSKWRVHLRGEGSVEDDCDTIERIQRIKDKNESSEVETPRRCQSERNVYLFIEG